PAAVHPRRVAVRHVQVAQDGQVLAVADAQVAPPRRHHVGVAVAVEVGHGHAHARRRARVVAGPEVELLVAVGAPVDAHQTRPVVAGPGDHVGLAGGGDVAGRDVDAAGVGRVVGVV